MDLNAIKEQAHDAVDLMIDELLRKDTLVNDEAITIQVFGNQFMENQVALHQVNSEITIKDMPVMYGPNYICNSDFIDVSKMTLIRKLNGKLLIKDLKTIFNSYIDTTDQKVLDATRFLTANGFSSRGVSRVVGYIRRGDFVNGLEELEELISKQEVEKKKLEQDALKSKSSHNNIIDRCVIEFYQMNHGEIMNDGTVHPSNFGEIQIMARDDGLSSLYNVESYLNQYNRDIILGDRPQISIHTIDDLEAEVDSTFNVPEEVQIDENGDVEPVTPLTPPTRRMTQVVEEPMSVPGMEEIIERETLNYFRDHLEFIRPDGTIDHSHYVNIVDICDLYGVRDVPLIHEYLNRMNNDINTGVRATINADTLGVARLLDEHLDDETEDRVLNAIRDDSPVRNVTSVMRHNEQVMERLINRFFEQNTILQQDDGVITTIAETGICRMAEAQGINTDYAREFIGDRNSAINEFNNPIPENEPAIADMIPDPNNPSWLRIDDILRNVLRDQNLRYGFTRIRTAIENELRSRCDDDLINTHNVTEYVNMYNHEYHWSQEDADIEASYGTDNPPAINFVDVADDEPDPGVHETRVTRTETVEQVFSPDTTDELFVPIHSADEPGDVAQSVPPLVPSLSPENPYHQRIVEQVESFCEQYEINFDGRNLSSTNMERIQRRCIRLGIPAGRVTQYFNELGDMPY